MTYQDVQHHYEDRDEEPDPLQVLESDIRAVRDEAREGLYDHGEAIAALQSDLNTLTAFVQDIVKVLGNELPPYLSISNAEAWRAKLPKYPAPQRKAVNDA